MSSAPSARNAHGPRSAGAGEAEHLITSPVRYARALVVGFDYDRPVRGRGAGMLLYVNGDGATAGCVPAGAMGRILAWADSARHPHLAIGTSSGPTAITRY